MTTQWLFDVEEFHGMTAAQIVSEEYWEETGYFDETVTLSDIQEDYPEFEFPIIHEGCFELRGYSVQEAEDYLKELGMRPIENNPHPWE